MVQNAFLSFLGAVTRCSELLGRIIHTKQNTSEPLWCEIAAISDMIRADCTPFCCSINLILPLFTFLTNNRSRPLREGFNSNYRNSLVLAAVIYFHDNSDYAIIFFL